LAFQFRTNSKFAILALDGVYSDLPDAEFQLSDGTWVMPRVPTVADLGVWKEWIGSIRAGSLQRSNLVLLAEEESRNPLILDEDHYRLRNDLAQLFYFLHFRQGIECAGANEPDLLCGSCKEGNSKADPCVCMAPDLVVTNTCPPLELPYSASKLEVRTRKLSMASRLGTIDVPMFTSSSTSLPFTLNPLEASRWLLMERLPGLASPDGGVEATPVMMTAPG
jgi:hypothetical protein